MQCISNSSNSLYSSKYPLKMILFPVLFYLAIKYALPLIAPFIFGLSIAALVQKPAALLSSRIPKLSRKLCCVILTSALIFASAAALCLIICSAVNGAVSLCPGIPAHLDSLRKFFSEASVNAKDASAWGKFTAFVASGANWCIDFFTENYRQYLPSVLGRSTRLVSGLPSLVAATVFAVMSALFACGEFGRIKASVKNWLSPQATAIVARLIKVSVSTVSALIKTYGTLMLITFAELVAGFGIMSLTGHGIGNIVTIALVISLIDILPVLGTGTILVPWGIFEIISGRFVSGMMLIVMYAIIETVRSLLEPKLIAGRLELHPFFTLAGVYIGGRLFGASGIFVMPLAMMIFREMRRQKNNAADSNAGDAC